MKVNRSIRSPNFDARTINVEFVVIHYTACGLQATFDIFRDPTRKVSSHLIISSSGEIYEVVKCWEGQAQRAWHAGKSSWTDEGKTWEEFNDYSIGIELVNNNGNLLSYTDKQYDSLIEVIEHLKLHYPAVQDPTRILGHEQIAGWRGKVDPGWMFDWELFYNACYKGFVHPERNPALPMELKTAIEKFMLALPSDEKTRASFWSALSLTLESAVGLINGNKP